MAFQEETSFRTTATVIFVNFRIFVDTSNYFSPILLIVLLGSVFGMSCSLLSLDLVS